MKKVKFSLRGCDESTHFEWEVSDLELDVLRRLEKDSDEKSTYSCMPNLLIHHVNEE